MNFCLFVIALTCLPYGRAEGFFSKFTNRGKGGNDKGNDDEESMCETVRVMPRIALAVVGGSPVRSENSAPYIAAIGERVSNGSVSWFCGGSLLSAFDVLTAAHCLISRNVTTIRVGSFSTAKKSSGDDYEISETIIHPEYKITESYNDIAIIKVKNKISFSENVKPVCLPTDDSDRYERERAKVIGWGAEEFGGEGTQKLQKVEVEVFTNSNCEKAYSNSTIAPKTFPRGIKREQLCAGSPKGGKDACQGDSGGPLVLTDETGIVRQIGIVSTGAGCGFKKYPGVYTRVSSYINWIQNQMNKMSTRPPQKGDYTSKEQNSNRGTDANSQQPSKQRGSNSGPPRGSNNGNGNARLVERPNSDRNRGTEFQETYNSQERPSQNNVRGGKQSKNTERLHNFEDERHSGKKGAGNLPMNSGEISHSQYSRYSESRDQAQRQMHSSGGNSVGHSSRFEGTTRRTTEFRERSQREGRIDEHELRENRRSGQRPSSKEQFSEYTPPERKTQFMSLNN